MRGEIVVAGEARRFEREVELTRFGLEVEHLDAAEQLGVARERDAVRFGRCPHAGVEILQRGGESLQVGRVAVRGRCRRRS